jgi:hypothetical protein
MVRLRVASLCIMVSLSVRELVHGTMLRTLCSEESPPGRVHALSIHAVNEDIMMRRIVLKPDIFD